MRCVWETSLHDDESQDELVPNARPEVLRICEVPHKPVLHHTLTWQQSPNGTECIQVRPERMLIMACIDMKMCKNNSPTIREEE